MANRTRPMSNAVALFTSDAMNRATTFVLYALVGRALGATEFGRLAIALTFFYIFQVIASAGLKTLITREVAKDLTKTNYYLVNGALVAAIASVAAYTTQFLAVTLL